MENNQAGALALLSMAGGLCCGLPFLLILITALMSNYLERTKQTMADLPWQSFFLGLVNFVFFFAFGAIFAEAGFVPLKTIALLSLFIVLPLMLLIGSVVAAGFAGERVLAYFTNRPSKPLLNLIIGIIGLGFSALVPIVGWTVLTILLMIGFGAALLTIFRRNGVIPIDSQSKLPAEPEEPETPVEPEISGPET
jgi:hypothetical protein